MKRSGDGFCTDERPDRGRVQLCHQEAAWLRRLAEQEKEQVWQYPNDRPHCYLLTNLEAFRGTEHRTV